MNKLMLTFCAFADGFYREEPLVIGKVREHRCFRQDGPWQWVTWKSNGPAWMTGTVFNGWLQSVYAEHGKTCCPKHEQCHKVMNGSPGVLFGMEVYRLNNVMLVVLPKTTSAVVQPMDAGIIRSFKARYKEWLCEQVFQLDKEMDCSGESTGDLRKV